MVTDKIMALMGELGSDNGSEPPINIVSRDTETPSLQTPEGSETGAENAKKSGGIALALGGGAARGWAHIGVLRAFDDENIPIKMIAGTSIGALVGGCYLAGKLDEMEEFARSITRSNILRFMDFTIGSSGLISGEKLAQRMGPHLSDINIEDIDREFISVATDIQTGHEIWLNDGPIIPAMRASYALPGVFRPVFHNNRFLVDGALVNPVPVSACRSAEPDIVIAVNLNSETFGRATVIRSSHYENGVAAAPDLAHLAESDVDEAVKTWFSFLSGKKSGGKRNKRKSEAAKSKIGVTGVMVEAFNIIQDRIARSRMAGDPPDYTIRPLLKDMGLTEFHRADEAIELGYEEGKHRIAELKRQGETLLQV